MASSTNRYYAPTASEQSLPPIKGPAVPLMSPEKPISLASRNAAPSPAPEGQGDIYTLAQEDQDLKRQIRHLRFASRSLTTLLSLAAFVPIAITLHAFLTTRYTARTLPAAGGGGDITRTAWHAQTRPWPTYMYFGVTLSSLLLNGAMLAAYARGVAAANRAHVAAVAFDATFISANLIVWSIAAAVYRTEKNLGGVPNDLWGWACSTGAADIQKAFRDEVNFNALCNVQTGSWAVGLVQVAGLVLSAVIWAFVFKRRKSKRTLRDSLKRGLLRERE